MTRRLTVILGGQVVGELRQDHRTTFQYDPAYLASQAATPLSLSMGLRPEPWPQAQVLPWIEGLLPDSTDVRQRWATQFGISARNPFALIAHMGQELPGAVQVAAADELTDLLTGRGELRPVTEEQIGRRLARLRADAGAWTVAGERWSLGGAQGKFALVERAGRWFEALGAAPTTHIVKPGVTGYAAQGMVEHVTMSALRSLGMRVVRTRYLEFDGQPAVVAERYDRLTRDGQIVRIHQEDLCQATSTPPQKKYETEGGPDAGRISDLLRNRADDDSNWRFVEAVAANALVGGSDAHAKNYSVLLSGRQARLAPLYDVASSLPYDPESTDSQLHKTAMAIGGERRFGRVTHREWQKFAQRTGVGFDRLRERVGEIAENLPDAIATAVDALPPSSERDQLRSRLLDRLPAAKVNP